MRTQLLSNTFWTELVFSSVRKFCSIWIQTNCFNRERKMIALIDEEKMAGKQQNAGGIFHLPVLLQPTISSLQPGPGKLFLDGTVGGGGHALALLEAGASVIGCEQDPEALEEPARRVARFSDRVRLVEANFADVVDLLPSYGVNE